MKRTIEIEVPEGKKAVWKDNKVIFEDIKPQLPKTWKEFCNQNVLKLDEYFIDYNCYLTGVNVDERNEISDRNILPNKQAAEQHLALMQLHQLRDCYRQGWIPSSIHTSFVIDKKIDNSFRIEAYGCTYRFLSFQSQEIAEEFLNNFRDLIEKVGDLI